MKRKFIWLFLTVVAMLATASLAMATSWSTGQMNFQRTGFNPTSSVDQMKLTKHWTYMHPSHALLWSEPVELNGRVFVHWTSFTAAFNLLEALDVNTGALLWSTPLAATGTAGRGTPTAATVDTTGAGDYADLVYVANGASGGAAGLDCYRAADGTPKFSAPSGGQRMRYTRPALADTNSDGKYDIVMAGTEGGRLYAWSASTGAFAWFATLDAGYYTLFGPSTSSDGKVAYLGTWAILTTGHGRVHAVNTTTGAIIGSFDPLIDGIYEDEGYPAAVVYIDDNTVCVAGYGVNGTDGRYTILDRNAVKLGQGSINNRAVFSSGVVYPDPLTGDTIFVVPTEGAVNFFGVPIVARARNIPTMRGGGSGFRYNLFACNMALPESPITAATSPDGFGIAAINTDDPDAKLYIFPAHSPYGTTNFDWWNKAYLASAGFLQRSGSLWLDGSSADQIKFITSEGYGAVHAFKESSTPRARWVDESFCYAMVSLNVPFPFNGSRADTITWYNIGNGAGSYTVSGTPYSASLNNQNITRMEVRARNTSSRREQLSLKLADELTVTDKALFMHKQLKPHEELALMDNFPELPAKSAFFTKQRETATTAAIPVWLTINDLTGGGPIAPGGSADIELIASSATLAKGTYYADLHMTVAPNEPDPDFYGGTDLILPIELIVGFVPEVGLCDASDAQLEITNYGEIAPSEDGFQWAGASGGLFGAGIVVITSDTVLEAAYDNMGHFLPENNILSSVVTQPDTFFTSDYVSEVHVCSTSFSSAAATVPLMVRQYTIGLFDGAFCDSMIIMKYVLENIGAVTCTLQVGLFMDWDLHSGANLGAADAAHWLFWLYDPSTDPQDKVGIMRKPSDDLLAGGFLVDNPTSIYGPTLKPDPDSLRKWFNTPAGTFDLSNNGLGPNDRSITINTSGIVLAPGEKHLEEYIIFGWDTTDVPLDKTVWKVWLRQEGFYRGDVNTDNRGHERSTAGVDLGPAANGGGINIVDVVYLVNYVLNGTSKPWPFNDQGDINCDGKVTLADVISLANYVFKGTNVPVDKNRFLPADLQAQLSRSSLWQNANWR